ncbi:MAG: hypothetical protein WCG26_12625, partial [Chloroflexales bacterium]
AKLIEALSALGKADAVLANPIVDAWLTDNLLIERAPGGRQVAVLRQGYAAPKIAAQRIERLTALLEDRVKKILTSKAKRRKLAEVLAEDVIEVLCRAEPEDAGAGVGGEPKEAAASPAEPQPVEASAP